MASNSYSPLQAHDNVVDHTLPQDGPPLTRVVIIALDASWSTALLHWVIDNIVQPQNDLVILVHVRVIQVPVAPYINATGYTSELYEENRESSHQLLKYYAKQVLDRKISCKAISLLGDPKAEVVLKASEFKADLVVVGSHQYGMVKRVLLGSVSDHIAHHCPCSVVIANPRIDPPNTSTDDNE